MTTDTTKCLIGVEQPMIFFILNSCSEVPVFCRTCHLTLEMLVAKCWVMFHANVHVHNTFAFVVCKYTIINKN